MTLQIMIRTTNVIETNNEYVNSETIAHRLNNQLIRMELVSKKITLTLHLHKLIIETFSF